jgi:hypothetical protein
LLVRADHAATQAGIVDRSPAGIEGLAIPRPFRSGPGLDEREEILRRGKRFLIARGPGMAESA